MTDQEQARKVREDRHLAAFLGDCGQRDCEPCGRNRDEENSMLARLGFSPREREGLYAYSRRMGR